MRIPFIKHTFLTILLVTAGLAVGVSAATPSNKPGKGDDFMPYVQLAPFVVQGKQLTISIHARSKGDRRYAEEFAERVAKVIYEGVNPETGKGLVIIGKKGEPHPVFVFRKFLALAKEGKLDPEIAAQAAEVNAMLDDWKGTTGEKPSDNAEPEEEEDDPEFEKIITALPLPLAGTGAKLYQLAWRENFDPAKVDAKLRALRPADLEGNLFARFDWVFYLPPRGAFEQAINAVVADALKEEKAGFFTRTLVKGVMLAVRGRIARAIEGLRQGMMFATVIRSCTQYDPEQVSALTQAYINAMKLDDDRGSVTTHEKLVQAVREAIQKLPEKPAEAAP